MRDDPEQFRDLYVRFYGSVLNYLRRRTDDEAARDIAAETFLITWRRIAAVPDDDPLPWLLRTARLSLANAVRCDRRRALLLTRIQSAMGQHAAADDMAESVTEAHRIRLALLALPPADAEILRLTSWEDLDTRQVAAVMGCTVAAAKVRLHRARRKLAAVLEAPAAGTPGCVPQEVRS